MSWRCPECKMTNEDDVTICDCGYENDAAVVNVNANVHVNESTSQNISETIPAESTGKWIIICTNCGREIEVDGEDAEFDRCPECNSIDIETASPFFKRDKPAKGKETESAPVRGTTGLFIREIRAESDDGERYHQKGMKPDWLTGDIAILTGKNSCEKIFGRNDLPPRGEYYYATISERHCCFRRDENGNWFVRDLDSTNGTMVEGVKLAGDLESPVDNEDRIQMANRLFIAFITDNRT